MTEPEFRTQYETLSAYLTAYFHDSEEESDEAQAEKILADESTRPEGLRLLTKDCERLLLNIDQEWQALGKVANTFFADAEEARRWLSSVYAIWDGHLRKDERRKPS